MGDNFNLALDSLYEALKDVKCEDCIFDEYCNDRRCFCVDDFCDTIWRMKDMNDHKEE